jgi:hypothetical protein
VHGELTGEQAGMRRRRSFDFWKDPLVTDLKGIGNLIAGELVQLLDSGPFRNLERDGSEDGVTAILLAQIQDDAVASAI